MKNKNSDKIEEEFKEEESDLEENIEEAEEIIENKDFNKFIQQPSVKSFINILEEIETPIIRSSPSLERINISQEFPIQLEQDLSKEQFVKKDKEDNFKYSFTTNQKDEPKYQSQEQTLAPKRTEIETLGRTELPQRQEVEFIHSQENMPSQTYEEYLAPTSQRIEELGKKEKPFERKEIKYEPTSNH